MDAAEPRRSESEAQRWLDKASDDLAVARMVAAGDVAHWAAGFHAQQATEKALKAVLVARGIDFPRTHSLLRLVDMLAPSADLLDRAALSALEVWAVAGRYPEDLPELSRSDAVTLVDAAADVFLAATTLLDGEASGT